MKRNIIPFAIALMMATAVAQPADAMQSDSDNLSTELTTGKPKKKTTKKSTASKKSSSTKKTSTAKKSATTTASTTTATDESTSTTSATTSGLDSGLFGGLVSTLTSVFDANKTASASDLVGTWKYTEPAVVFESSNALKNIGGKVASATIENKLQEQFNKVGIKKGAMKMTFDKDGNFTQTIGKKTMSGTYTISGKQVKLTYTGGISQLVGTTQLSGGKLLIVMEASKLLKYAGTLGKLTGNSTISTLSSLLGSYDGMEVGLTLEK